MALKTRSEAALIAAILASSALLLWCACGPTGPPDAGHDAGLDAGRDAGPLDAGVRLWRRVEGLPDDCVIELAVDPNAALGRLAFEDCPGAPAGCRQVIVDWPTHPELSNFSVHNKPYTGPGTAVFTYGRASQEGSVARFYYIAATLSGDLLVAARSRAPDPARDAWCSIAGLLVDRDEATFVVLRKRADFSGNEKFYGRVSYAAPATVRPLWRASDQPTTITDHQLGHVADGIIGYMTGLPVRVYRIDREGDLDLIAPAGRDEPYHRDRARAYQFFGSACEGGNTAGCRNVGIYLRDGLGGLSADMNQARPYFQRACQAGNEQACADARG